MNLMVDPIPTTGEPIDQGILVDALATLSADNERLRKFVQQVAEVACSDCGVEMQKSNDGSARCPYCNSWAFRDAVSDGAIYAAASKPTTKIDPEVHRMLAIVTGDLAMKVNTLRDALRAAKSDPMACHSIAVWDQIDTALKEVTHD